MIGHPGMDAVLALAAAGAGAGALTLVSPVVVVAAVLAAAVLCFALGTFRGSWRVWLMGYALAVAALVLAYGGVRREQRAAAIGPHAPPTARPAGATPASPAGAPAAPVSPRVTEPRR